MHPAIHHTIEILPDSFAHRKLILKDILTLLPPDDPLYDRAHSLLHLLYAHEQVQQQLLPLPGPRSTTRVGASASPKNPDSISDSIPDFIGAHPPDCPGPAPAPEPERAQALERTAAQLRIRYLAALESARNFNRDALRCALDLLTEIQTLNQSQP